MSLPDWPIVKLVGCFLDWCGSLGVIGLQKLIGSGTIRKDGLVEVDMAMLEKVCHCGGGL